jgi:hypothetical protein
MSLLGSLAKVAGGFLTAGPAGAVAAASTLVSGATGPSTTSTSWLDKYRLTGFGDQNGATATVIQRQNPQLFPAQLPTPDSVKVQGTTISVGPGGINYGAPQATAYFPGVQSGSSSTAAACTNGSGTHLNKTGYFLKSGQYVAPRTKCVKNRRRNPLNPRALSRSMSRLASAKRAAKALDRFEIKGRCRR